MREAKDVLSLALAIWGGLDQLLLDHVVWYFCILGASCSSGQGEQFQLELCPRWQENFSTICGWGNGAVSARAVWDPTTKGMAAVWWDHCADRVVLYAHCFCRFFYYWCYCLFFFFLICCSIKVFSSQSYPNPGVLPLFSDSPLHPIMGVGGANEQHVVLAASWVRGGGTENKLWQKPRKKDQ